MNHGQPLGVGRRGSAAEPANRARVKEECQLVSVALDRAEDLHGLGDELENLLVEGAAIDTHHEQVKHFSLGVGGSQDGWHAATDAAHRTGAMCLFSPRLHDPQIALGIDDFTDQQTVVLDLGNVR